MDGFEDTVLGALLGAVLGAFSGLAVQYLAPKIRRDYLTEHLTVEKNWTHGDLVGCRIVNEASDTILSAVAYLTLEHKQEDVLAPPADRDAFVRPGMYAKLYESQLAWAVRVNGSNPLHVDIYSKEKQPLMIARVTEDYIEILSEAEHTSRAFLRRQIYEGQLKIVSRDTAGKCFQITLDPDHPTASLQLRLA